jgi:hypothetical protein
LGKWLEGTFRDDIAKELQISQGAVSSIINDFRKDDIQFDPLREVAVKIKKQGMDPASFAPLARLCEILRERCLLTGTTVQESLEQIQNRMEGLIVSLEVLCYGRNLSIEDVSLVSNMYDTAGILGVPLDRFPEYIVDLKHRIEVLVKDIDVLETKKQELLKEYRVTSESLEDYNAHKPLIVKIQKLERALADAEEALENERVLNKLGEEFEWSVSVTELIKINTQLGNHQYHDLDGTEPLGIGHLKGMVMELYHHPSEYPELIRDLIHEQGLRHERQEEAS